MSMLQSLGFDPMFYGPLLPKNVDELTLGRVIEQQRGLQRIQGISAGVEGEWWADVSGKLYYNAHDPADFPQVGDWVLASPGQLHDRLQILEILPRRSELKRKSPEEDQVQILAANIDGIFVVTSLNQDLNVSRLERYRLLAEQSGLPAILLLTKADLMPDTEERALWEEKVRSLFPCLSVSVVDATGMSLLHSHLEAQKTYVFIGSSGVGKSTLVNALLGSEELATGSIRISDGRGRHTTSHRSLKLLPSGAIVIDTPGIRELGLWHLDEQSLDASFADIEELGQRCRYRDCSHQSEPGCAIQEALALGQLSARRWSSYGKLQKEQAYYERRVDKQKMREEKEKWKAIHKSAKNLKKERQKW